MLELAVENVNRLKVNQLCQKNPMMKSGIKPSTSAREIREKTIYVVTKAVTKVVERKFEK